MRNHLLSIIGLAFAMLLPSSALAATEWEPRVGDTVVVDISTSTVYLVHNDGEYAAVDALTGQWKTVHYDGITYFARTPVDEWEARETGFKGRSVTFGEEGEFLRLSRPGQIDPRFGDERSAYLFHSHLLFDEMLADKHERNEMDPNGTGHRSMGCILVSEEDLDTIVEMWKVNGGTLKVSTRDFVDVAEFDAMGGIAKQPSWLGWLPNAIW